MKWKIGNIQIDNQIVVAPMAGITNPAYRSILKDYGAGLIYTEMISDKGLTYQNQKTFEMLEVNEKEKPIVLQLFGSEVESMVNAAIIVDRETGADIIDINMGCPVQKVVKSGAGSRLMLYPEKVYAIVKSVVEAVEKPVTVKIRSGWDHDHINAVEIAKIIEKAGAKAIAIHGRTRSQMYSGKADWDIIKQVKNAVSIPVIGNGDISSPESAKEMLNLTGCDAVMIGRGLLGNPFLVKQIVNFLDTGSYEEHTPLDERKATIIRHYRLLKESKGEHLAVLEMRSHGAWYIKGMKNSAHIKSLISGARSEKEFLNIIDDYFDFLKTI
ncbi:MAG: tRNA dihydrouridine synthase DusB [Bacilli bacterium]|nr:tRNA dihydrouridine synthase DusB [Bacilli bacterium]